MRSHTRSVFVARRSIYALAVLGVGLILLTPPMPPARAQMEDPRAPSSSPVPVTFGPDLLAAGDRRTRGAVEPANAFNSLNPTNLVVGFIDDPGPNAQVCGFSYSADGGSTWTYGGRVPSSADLNADPSIASDPDGNFFYAYLDAFNLAGGGSEFFVRVAKSTDGGRTFPTFSVAVSGSFPDKELIAVDTSARSRQRGTIYLAYSDRSGIGIDLRVVVSGDGGASWSAPRILAAAAPGFSEVVIGAVPVIASDGTAYVFWSRFVESGPPMSIEFSKSEDGGDTWSPPAPVVAGLPSPAFFRLKNESKQFGKQPYYGMVADALPRAAAGTDRTLFVVWSDVTRGSCVFFSEFGAEPACSNSDVWLSVSHNAGVDWSAPVTVSDDTGAADQFFPAVATHPDGLLSISWQDKRLDPKNSSFDAFYSNTFDGTTFLPNVRVSTVTSPSGARFGGDYNWMAVSGDLIVPVWWDRRLGRSDIFTAVGRLQR